MRKLEACNENGRTILLVEGDHCLRILIREYLEANGFDVKDAPNASEAMRIAGTWGCNKPDMLVADSRLADASGAWLAGKLRESFREGMAVVYLVREELDMQTLDGADRHVQKPFSFLQLHSAIEDAFMTVERSASEVRPVPWLYARA
jgi:two-component system, OmpR family, KDP operon response regulator KdpE